MEDIREEINSKIIDTLNENTKNYEKIILILDNRTLILMKRVNTLLEKINYLEDKLRR